MSLLIFHIIPVCAVLSSVYETTINLWEDEHQDPVPVTFTNPSLLDDQDGYRDEFGYSGRSYQSIFAGNDEWVNHDLQPMQFFTDGFLDRLYKVWVNLYTERHTFYYYGFSEAEALEETRWVDNVAGQEGQKKTKSFFRDRRDHRRPL